MGDYLLVHGAMCGGWVWDDVARRLTGAGHRVRVVEQLPSAGTDPTALGDLSADADHVRPLLDKSEEPVVLVGHSYGGMVITEFADHPKVRHSIYLTAYWPQRGQSLLGMFGGLPKSFIRRDDGALELTGDFEVAWKGFCPDADRARATEMLSRLVLQSESSVTATSTAPARAHPTTYLIATRESAGSVAAQEAMAANADVVARLPAAHMLLVTLPDEVAEALGRV